MKNKKLNRIDNDPRFVRAFRVVETDKKTEYIPTSIPAVHANDHQLLRVTNIILAKDMEGSFENIKESKETYRSFLNGSSDIIFLSNLKNIEKEPYKKDLIDERIYEIQNEQKLEPVIAETMPEPKKELKKRQTEETEKQENETEGGNE